MHTSTIQNLHCKVGRIESLPTLADCTKVRGEYLDLFRNFVLLSFIVFLCIREKALTNLFNTLGILTQPLRDV
jgi:hypothetical protein